MAESGLDPDASSFRAAVSARERGGRRQAKLESRAEPYVVTRSAAVGVRQRGGLWQAAHGLLRSVA
eukprot:7679206-Alexandrium_andersonii.AAC.1